jgi:hypothetical protein
MTSISQQIRSRPDFKLNTKVFYKKHTWRVAFFQPEWREKNRIQIQEAWYRNRKITQYLSENENTHWKTRADSFYFVYLTRPDRIPELLDQWGDSVVEIIGPINERHQDIMLEDLQVVTRKKLWYNKYRYKISSQRHGQTDQEIFEEMQEFCHDSFEPGTYKLSDTFRRASKEFQKRMMKTMKKYSSLNGYPNIQSSLFGYRTFMPYTATGSIYLENHDDVVTLHMMYKQYITTSQKVITFDELE